MVHSSTFSRFPSSCVPLVMAVFGLAVLLASGLSGAPSWAMALAGLPAAAGLASIARDARRRAEAWRRGLRARRRLHARLSRVAVENAWLRGLLDRIPDAVRVVDSEGRPLFHNRRALELASSDTGPIDRDGNPGSWTLLRTDGTPVNLADCPLTRAWKRREQVQCEDLLLLQRDGSSLAVDVSATPLYDRAGRMLGAASVYRDVSRFLARERRRNEWDAVIAHDLRQPLSTIAIAVELIRQVQSACGSSSQVERRALDRIAASSTRLSRMVGDLLDVSRLEARRLELRRREIDLRDLLVRIGEGASEVLRDHLLRLELRPALPKVYADADRLEQVIGNLLSNAAKYGRPGTVILLRATADEATVSISVTNEGKGLRPEEIGLLFERFQRTTSARTGNTRGIGLGLYIVRGLVEAHGGTVAVRSVPDRETTFEVRLPALPEAPLREGPTHRPAAAASAPI